MEDLRDVFAVSYEMAAHRFTNLATHHLGLPCHFVKNDAGGIIYKAYENDGVLFPADAAGAIEGQRMCRQWSGRQVFTAADRFSPYYQYSDTPSGTYWCVGARGPGGGARLRDHARRAVRALTLVPGPGDDPAGRRRPARTAECCQRPPAGLAARWEGQAWPSARAHSHILLALPAGSFPGVDEADVFAFLERHAAGLTAQRADGKSGGRLPRRAAAPSLHVVAHEGEHLVGRRLVEDRARHPQPAVQRPLGQPDGELAARWPGRPATRSALGQHLIGAAAPC